MVVDAVPNNDCSNAPECLLIQEIHSLFLWFNIASCCYVSRKFNMVAHSVIRLAFSKSVSAILLDNFGMLTPVIINETEQCFHFQECLKFAFVLNFLSLYILLNHVQ